MGREKNRNRVGLRMKNGFGHQCLDDAHRNEEFCVSNEEWGCYERCLLMKMLIMTLIGVHFGRLKCAGCRYDQK